jgi:DNA repair ATPase RecN
LPEAVVFASGMTLRMLAYAERVRVMPPAELTQETARLGDAASPEAQVQLSLVLSQLRQMPELIRAQELLARVLGNADAQALHPLARLLASRYAEQRRLEEQLDKQNQQLRDVQRRLDQTNERLEALKAIERSLTSRPPASPASAPASRTRPAAP